MKIVTILGARPQFIKSAMISREISKHKNINEHVIHTGQHFDENMSKIFFTQMNIPKPKYNLNINSLSHGAMTGRQIEEIEKVLLIEKPNFVIVYGDTNSTLAGALASIKLNIPIAHIEAGLRSFNRKMPEEINRVLTDHCSEILFTPTKNASKNLLNEGINKEKIHEVGDVMYDALLHFRLIAERNSSILNSLNVEPKNYFLATIHRQENTEDSTKLIDILTAVADAPMIVILPLHPRTKKRIDNLKISISSNLKIINPIGYLDMLVLQKNAEKIITDSGGIQKEAYFNNVHCITLREETEWKELVQHGVNEIVGTSKNKIERAFKIKAKISKNEIYGNGKASGKIIDIIINS
jgi:UDP-GlcNAc3NAcA epimerase